MFSLLIELAKMVKDHCMQQIQVLQFVTTDQEYFALKYFAKSI